jgi:hypothetical protein
LSPEREFTRLASILQQSAPSIPIGPL